MQLFLKIPVVDILRSFLGFLAITILAYRIIFDGWFVADDFLWIDISDINSVLDSFVGPWGHGRAYRPITRVTYFIDFLLHGRRFAGWIFTNIVLHAMVSTALYRLSMLVFRNRVTEVIFAVLFCLSPIAAENVAWISGRTHILSTLFIVLGIIATLHYLQGRRYCGSGVLGGIFFAGGLLCYEAAVHGIAFCALAIASIGRKGRVNDIRCLWMMGLWLAILLVYLVVRERALSSMPHAFSIPREPSWTGLVRDFRLSANILFGWSQLAIPLALVGGAAFFLSPKAIATAAISCIALILVALMPFLVLEDIGTRFFYSSQAFVAAFAAFSVRVLLQDRRIWVKWAGGAFICFVLFNSVVRISDVTRDWRDSGLIARSLAIQVKSLLPNHPNGEVLLIHGAPIAYGSAPLFIGYLDKVVRRNYDKFDGVILNSWEFGDVSYLPHSIRGQVANVKSSCPSVEDISVPDFMEVYGNLQALHDLIFKCPVRFFAFDRKSLTIRQVTKNEWFELFEDEPGMLRMP